MADLSERPLTPRQQKALAALLSCPNLATAAKNCGIPERTLFRYRRDPNFARVYRESRSLQVEQAGSWLQAFSNVAAVKLGQLINDAMTTSAVQVSACKTILDGVMKLREIENVEGRIAELEQRLNRLSELDQQKGKGG